MIDQQTMHAPPRHSRVRRMLGPGLVAIGVLGVGVVMHLWDPNKPSAFPGCPLLALTGFYCPGCGSTRAIHALAHGDFVTAMERNPLAVIAFAIVFVGVIRWTLRLWRGEPLRTLAKPWVLWSLIPIIVGYWVLRNVPGFEFLAP